jgi:hypothetical protein
LLKTNKRLVEEAPKPNIISLSKPSIGIFSHFLMKTLV